LFCFSIIIFFVISCLHCYIADDLFWIACYITFKMYKNTTSLNWCLILQYSTWFCQLKQLKIKFIIGKKRKPVFLFLFFFYCSWGKKNHFGPWIFYSFHLWSLFFRILYFISNLHFFIYFSPREWSREKITSKWKREKKDQPGIF